MNQYESQYMREQLKREGFMEAVSFKEADINIINSCTVTSVADAKNRKCVNRIRRENISTVIVLTGCMPQTVSFDDDPIYDKCDIIVGNDKRSKITECIREYLDNHVKTVDVRAHEKGEQFEDLIISGFDEHTRAFMKIEDGCNQFCTYCTIPYARGRVRSKSLESIKKETENLALSGYKEIVLVGINLSCYGEDIGKDITDAVNEVCRNEKIQRVRLGSYEPERLSDEMIEKLSKEKKFCDQFHLSLQSGCTETLKRMHRHYSSEEYMKIIEDIRKHFDNPSITTDIMVGFAGETREEFLSSLHFVEKAGFSRVHIFPYSRRKGTKAYSYDDQVDEATKKKRCREMEKAAREGRTHFLETQVGRIEPVLFEILSDDGYYCGYTKNYTQIRVKSDKELFGEIRNVEITCANDDYCSGVLCEEKQ